MYDLGVNQVNVGQKQILESFNNFTHTNRKDPKGNIEVALWAYVNYMIEIEQI